MIKLHQTDIKIVDGDRGENYPKKSDFSSNGECLFLDASNVSNKGFSFDNKQFISLTHDKKMRGGKLIRNDIVLTTRGTIGNFAYYDSKIPYDNVRINSGMLIIRNGNNFDTRYLYYLLKSPFIKNQINNITTGSSQPQLTRSIVQELSLLNPDISEQRSISKILESIDNKIELNNNINFELEQLAKTIYDYWFVQFDFPDKDGKPYKSSGGKMIYNEQLKREIPEGWEVKKLDGLIKFERGLSYTSQSIESNEGIPMINLACIDINRNYRPNELKYYTGKYSDRLIVHHGDMLIACTDLTRNADIIGSPIIVPNESKNYLFSMDLAKLTTQSDKLVDLYLFMTLRTDFYHHYIKYFASGTNVLHLNLDGILWYPTIIPPKPLQQKYSNLLSTFIDKQAEILNENQELIKLRDWLLPMLMSGQVKVKE